MKESIYEKERYNMLTSEAQEVFDEIEADFISNIDWDLLGNKFEDAHKNLHYMSDILEELQDKIVTLEEQFENEQERADIAVDDLDRQTKDYENEIKELIEELQESRS